MLTNHVSYTKTNQFSGALSAPVGQEVNFPTINVEALTEQVNDLQHRYARKYVPDCEVKTAADAYYFRAIVFLGFGLMFPPLLIGTAICVYKAKQAEKGGAQ